MIRIETRISEKNGILRVGGQETGRIRWATKAGKGQKQNDQKKQEKIPKRTQP